MLMRKFLALVFLAFSFVILTSADGTRRPETNDQILARLSDYKSWKQVNRTDADPATGTFVIADSAPAG